MSHLSPFEILMALGGEIRLRALKTLDRFLARRVAEVSGAR